METVVVSALVLVGVAVILAGALRQPRPPTSPLEVPTDPGNELDGPSSSRR